MQVLKWFKSISGLVINNEKNKVVKIWASRDNSIPWQGKFGFNWSTTFEILGTYYDITKMGELNIYRKMGEIRKLISIWSSRNLTPYGKVSIIKSLLMSKITHMLLSLSSPDVICIKELYNTFSNFLWCGKPPKWRKEILKGEIHHRGLKLHNIALFDQTLKLSCLRRFLSSKSKWTVFTDSFELNDAFTFGLVYLDSGSILLRAHRFCGILKWCCIRKQYAILQYGYITSLNCLLRLIGQNVGLIQ